MQSGVRFFLVVQILFSSFNAYAGDLISFCGEKWFVSERHGSPGDNHFSSDSLRSLGSCTLILSAKKIDGQRHGAEIMSAGRLGFGKYSISVSFKDRFPSDLVFGFFNFPQHDEYLSGTSEIDIELSKWGVEADFVTMGAYHSQKHNSPKQISSSPPVECSEFELALLWTLSYVDFTVSCPGFVSNKRISDGSDFVLSKTPMNFFLNLWWFSGGANSDSNSFDVIVKNFKFEPFVYGD